jgi:hypothetical protein
MALPGPETEERFDMTVLGFIADPFGNLVGLIHNPHFKAL